jgi:hypothetical protein
MAKPSSGLGAFSEGLFENLPGGRETSHRPLVCDGSPLNCRTFVVGYNNRHEMGSFKDLWSDDTGFNKRKFDELFIKVSGQPTNKTSNRYWIDHISNEVGQCLQTNLFSKDSARAQLLSKNERSTAVFDYLFRTLKPSVLFCFNSKVIKEFESRIGVSVPLIAEHADPRFVTMFDHTFLIIGHDHGWLSSVAPHFNELVGKLRNRNATK